MLPILFESGPIKVYSFGVMVIVAFALCYYLAWDGFKKLDIERQKLNMVIAIIAISAFFGAKLFYIFEIRHAVNLGLIQSFELNAGLVWYGGFFFSVIAGFFYIGRWHQKRLDAIDVLMPLVLLGYAIGRIGCFLAGDGDYGPPSDLPWAMAFPNGVVPVATKVHPTPLYDSALSFTFFLITQLNKKRWQRGITAIIALFFLGLTRFITEFFRTTEIWYFGWFTLAHVFSLFLMGSAIFWFLTVRIKNNK
ncbi:MAG: hypothetical protein DWQ10_01695 [Calditrichaeota bacterium]|nr:MAG: hypothetical protein DWQ10_01695 [Calditrichota bacterium]